jgi:Flp pilus assembly protein TadD
LLVSARMQDQEQRNRAPNGQELASLGVTTPESRSPHSQSSIASKSSAPPRNGGSAGQAIDELHDPDALVEKGSLLYRLRKTTEATAAFEAARRMAPNHELALTNLAIVLADSGQRHEAVIAFRKILSLNPNNTYVQHHLRRLTSIMVPFWHARMLNDTARNDAFERAIQAALAKEGQLPASWTLAQAAVSCR